jgi:hypothetical protein
MNITAIFPEGQTHVTVNGLHQWDYGRTLTVKGLQDWDDDPTEEVELHFGYQGIREAVVVRCDVQNDAATVSIPDVCLEQPSPVTVWVYKRSSGAGRTLRTVTLPIIARPRPAAYIPTSD